MSRNQRLAVVSAAPDTRSSPYAPGAIRSTTDDEHSRMCAFCSDHPEFVDRLGYEGLKQVAATYLDDADRAVRNELRAAGVREDWHRADDEGGFRLAEEC